jgi:FkbM family methyltransferase
LNQEKVNLKHHQHVWRSVIQQLPPREWPRFFKQLYFPQNSSGKTSQPQETAFHPKKLKGRSVCIRRGTTDIEILLDLLAFERYMPEEFDGSEETILDLGANIGVTTAHFAASFPKSKVIGVELEKENFDLAQKNTRFAKDRTRVLHGAVWSFSGVVPFSGVKEDAYAVSPSGAFSSEVQSFTVEELIRAHHLGAVDYVKMDIEGAEYQVFLEGDPTWLQKVKSMMIEIHSDEHLAPIMRVLTEFNFKVRRSNKHWRALWAKK